MVKPSRGDPKLSSVLHLIGLMGREAFAAWSSGQPQGSTSEAIQDMLTVYQVFGEEEFQRMVQAEFGGSPAPNAINPTPVVPPVAEVGFHSVSPSHNTYSPLLQSSTDAPLPPLDADDGLKLPTALVRSLQKECTNCGTTHTSRWRHSLTGEWECNACNLHRRQHAGPRPADSKAPQPEIRRRKCVRPVPDEESVKSEEKVCANCDTTQASSWVRSSDGSGHECSACYQHMRKHGKPRPAVRAATHRVQTRRRK